MQKVLAGLFIAFVLIGGCMRGAAMETEPPPEPKFKVTWTPRPAPTYAPPAPVETTEPTTDEPDDVYVDVDHEDDDGESWFCRKRRWC